MAQKSRHAPGNQSACARIPVLSNQPSINACCFGCSLMCARCPSACLQARRKSDNALPASQSQKHGTRQRSSTRAASTLWIANTSHWWRNAARKRQAHAVRRSSFGATRAPNAPTSEAIRNDSAYTRAAKILASADLHRHIQRQHLRNAHKHRDGEGVVRDGDAGAMESKRLDMRRQRKGRPTDPDRMTS